MSDSKKGNFSLIAKTKFADISEGTIVPESDLCFQSDDAVYQFKYNKPPEEAREVIKPGIYDMKEVNGSVKLKESELRTRKLLTSVINTQKIIEEANDFFNSLEELRELEEELTFKVLAYSAPGMGKTATITHYCNYAIEQDPGTAVIIWPTSDIDSGTVLEFLTKESEYDEKTTRLIFIMEDIGGGEREGSSSSRAVDSALLDILDGIRTVFRKPTFIFATTNYPENLLSALADRPGRFDTMIELSPPNYTERVQLAKFIAKRELTEEEMAAFKIRGAENFSIAHIKEVVKRSRRKKRSFEMVINELIAHTERYKNGFEKEGRGNAGFRVDSDD